MPVAPTRVAPIRVALPGCCLRCGKGLLFASIIGFAPACRVCGLDFTAFNVGDGAVSFIVLIVGAIVVVLAVWLELGRSPPWHVHVIIGSPLALALTLGLTRFAKALLAALEYRHCAGGGHQ